MKHKRLIIYIVVFAAAIFLVYEALITRVPGLWHALKSGNEAEIEGFLNASGKWTGLLALGLLQAIQVVSIVLPGAPIQIAGGMVYGAFKAYLVCHFMYVFTNAAIMTAVRKFSGLSDLLGSGNKTNIQKALNFINKGNPLVTVSLLCMLPIVPNGIIPYAASQMDIRIKSFTISVFAGSFYPILSVVLAGKFIVTGNYTVSALLIVANVALVIVTYLCRGKISALVDRLLNK